MRRLWRHVLFGIASLALLGAQGHPDQGNVVAVRHWSYPDYTRVVIELDRPVSEKTDLRRLPPNPEAERPERLYIDIDGIWVGRRFAEGVPVGDGLLGAIRIGQNTREAIRVVLDLDAYVSHRVMTLAHPDRLVIDVYGPREGGETLRWPEKESGEAPRLPAGMREIRTVVLDPGHGGRDPGAVGVGGLKEKDVTLRLARALSPLLEARGFDVVLTRQDDTKLGLEERTALAEAARGDLFVSLHANAAPRRSVHGIETYYLDENHERHSLTVASRENGVPRGQLSDLQRTLARLRVSEVSPHSYRLAKLVQNQIVAGMPARRKPRDLGVKKGPFYVLFLSSMPAILLEAGFLTNSNEAKLLRDGHYLDALAEQVAEAISDYRRKPATVALRGDRR